MKTSGWPLAHGVPQDTTPICTLSATKGPPESPCDSRINHLMRIMFMILCILLKLFKTNLLFINKIN